MLHYIVFVTLLAAEFFITLLQEKLRYTKGWYLYLSHELERIKNESKIVFVPTDWLKEIAYYE